MDLDLIEFSVDHAKARGASYAEARYEQQTQEAFVLKNGVLDALEFTEGEGVGVRVLARGSLGFAATNLLTKADLKATVDAALRNARAAKRKRPIRFAPEPAVTSNWSVPEARKLVNVPIERKIEDVQHIDREVADLKLRMPARLFRLEAKRIVKYFANSEGSHLRSYSPRVRMYYYLTVAKGGDAEQCHRNYGWSGGWEALEEWKALDHAVEEARAENDALEHGVKSPEGRMDLVAGPHVSGIAAHESCGHPTEADRVLGREASQAGKSFLRPDSLGTKVGSEVVNVCDDPTLEHAIAFYLYDDEGVKARRRYLYKEGRVNEFLQNRETAAVLATKSNGAARATDYDREAIVRMANTFVEPKDWSVDEMIEGVKRGIYMKSFMEWNIDDKRWNGKYVGREAYLIENGEIKGPVRKTVLEITTPAFWSAVDAVGKDLDFEGGYCGKSDPQQALDAAMGGPTIRLRDVHLR